MEAAGDITKIDHGVPAAGLVPKAPCSDLGKSGERQSSDDSRRQQQPRSEGRLHSFTTDKKVPLFQVSDSDFCVQVNMVK